MRHAVSGTRPGPIATFLEALQASLEKGTFVRLILSYRGSDPDACQRAVGRLIDLKERAHLSFTLRFQRRDEVTNVVLAEGIGWVKSRLGPAFSGALLGTTERDWQLTDADKPGKVRLVRHKPATREKPIRQHDLSGPSFLDAAAQGWLAGLGVTDAHGRVLPSRADKFRQINHYLEILSHLWQGMGWQRGEG